MRDIVVPVYEPADGRSRPEVIARGEGVGGEVVLRRRYVDSGADVLELIVNGVFLMDTDETSTEELLADVLLERHPAPRRVLVGGLGLGFTAAKLLADPRVEHVEVVELEPLLVQWLRAGLVPNTGAVLADPRLHITVDDVRSALQTTSKGQYDAILLDVDNGPDFLVHEANAEVYQQPSLRAADRALAPGGMLAIWSAAPSDQLSLDLAETFSDVEELLRAVSRQDRDVDYYVYLAQHRPA